MVKVYVEVSGGNVYAVYADCPGSEIDVIVCDYDNAYADDEHAKKACDELERMLEENKIECVY